MRIRARPAPAFSLASAILLLASTQAFCQGMPISDPSQEPTLEFEVSAAPESGDEERLEVTRTAPGEIVLAGIISTPNPCYGIGAKLDREGATLTLTLTATARPGFCVQMIGAFAYTATIGRLQAGGYDVVVVHEYPGTGWERRTFRQQAEVPGG